ncbi:hypothetical protein [Joostella sp. CR20]|uniref:hypothetical protein n=1 Tax=Joostella sp. CR20 TaxID=2804312 RepID=UPI00313C8DB5
MSTITQQQTQTLLRLLANSRMTSELVEEMRVLKDKLLIIQSGTDDATGVKVEQLRGYLGSYNANTNTVTLSDGSTMILTTDNAGVAGEWVNVTADGSQNYGSGIINLVAGDRLRHDGVKWYKDSSLDNALIVPEDKEMIVKRGGNTLDSLQVGDRVWFKKVDDNGTEITLEGHKYNGGDATLYASYSAGSDELVED